MTVRGYDRAFYRDQAGRSDASAHVIVPIVTDLVHPRSVIDVGCGTGAWLAAFKDHGVPHVQGIDGGAVSPEALRVDRSEIISADLADDFPVEERFDLAICLEVAEHLDESHAEHFVGQLVRLAPVVLFSAAIPYQGGTHHVNEQWPSYWQRKFQHHGYSVLDCVCPRVWLARDVELHYAQNTLLFVQRDHLTELKQAVAAMDQAPGMPLDLVHPQLFSKKMRHPILTRLSARFPRASIRAQNLLGMKR